MGSLRDAAAGVERSLRGAPIRGHAASMEARHAGSALLTDPIERARVVPIGDYGFLSDGEVSALVAPAGAVEWMCVPRFDAGSVFGAMLGQRAGSFRVAPLDARVPAARR